MDCYDAQGEVSYLKPWLEEATDIEWLRPLLLQVVVLQDAAEETRRHWGALVGHW